MSNGRNVIEKLKKRLYRKGETFKEREMRSPLRRRFSKVKTYWEGSPSEEAEEAGLVLPENRKKFSMKQIVIILFAASFLVIAGFAIYLFGDGPNIVSSKNIELSLEGPFSVKGGEGGKWQVVIVNKNQSNIDTADLIIVYPENSKPITESQSGARTLYERRTIGSIAAGETVIVPVSAYLFGEKDSNKVFKLTLEYRPQDSNAILERTAERTIRLLQSPLEIVVNLPKDTNAGETIDLSIEVISNAEIVMKDLTLKIDYPVGFIYQESDLKPSSGDDVWRLGDMEPNAKRAIKIRGTLSGQDLVELSFRVSAGPTDGKGDIIAYGFGIQSVILKKPFLSLGALVNGEKGEVITPPGNTLRINIECQNTLPAKIYNAVIEAKIKGAAVVDERTIAVKKGFYRSFDRTLVWNQSSLRELAVIDPLSTSGAEFEFFVPAILSDSVIKEANPKIILEIKMKAERISEESGKMEVENNFIKEIKIATVFKFARKGFYYSGPFQNTGPIPPKAGQETTYTVVWSLTNSSSAVSDVIANAFLPSYVKWLNVIEPKDADVSYNEKTGEIIWRASRVEPGSGSLIPAKELAFQISFLPSESQILSTPVLVSEVSVTGKDTFTGIFLRDTKTALTTYLDGEPNFLYDKANVIN